MEEGSKDLGQKKKVSSLVRERRLWFREDCLSSKMNCSMIIGHYLQSKLWK